MPKLAKRRSNLLRRLAAVASALTLISLAAPDASAQGRGLLSGHYREFYGQDFYTRGIHAHFPPLGPNRVYRGYSYGPAMMYGREYGEQYGYNTALPFRPARSVAENTAGGS